MLRCTLMTSSSLLQTMEVNYCFSNSWKLEDLFLGLTTKFMRFFSHFNTIFIPILVSYDRQRLYRPITSEVPSHHNCSLPASKCESSTPGRSPLALSHGEQRGPGPPTGERTAGSSGRGVAGGPGFRPAAPRLQRLVGEAAGAPPRPLAAAHAPRPGRWGRHRRAAHQTSPSG